jgi:penicillin G amidase
VLQGALGPDRAASYAWPNRDTLLDTIAMQRPSSWLPKEYATYADLFLDCWREARAALAKKAGDDPAAWTWGRLADPVVFAHPLAGVPEAGARFAIGPIPASTGGSGETVNAGGAVSMRFIADLADWDRSRMGITLGESGDPGSPHWKDQLDAWRSVKTPAFPFSPRAVARATVEVQVLAPQGK